jgi:hypothetical protein
MIFAVEPNQRRYNMDIKERIDNMTEAETKAALESCIAIIVRYTHCEDYDTAVEYVFDLELEAAVIYQTMAWTKEPPNVDGLQRDLLWQALKEAHK